MTDTSAQEAHNWHLIQTFFHGEGRTIEFDDFQVSLDPYNKQIRINLSGEQVTKLQKWGLSEAKR